MNTARKRNTAILCSGLAAFALTDLLSAQRGRGDVAERTRRLVKQFDEDKSGSLNADERTAAQQWLKENPRGGPGRGRGRGGRGGGQNGEPEEPKMPKTFLDPGEISQYPDSGLYDNTILRTIFLDFPQDDWMAELDAFYRTDVEVPAKMTVDGKIYEGVGTAFRGNSSYFTVSGPKKSFNITMDFQTPGQRLYGYKTLNLLNGHADETFLREVIHSEVGNRYAPVMQACLVRLVINGESWGVYVNVQQYNKDFLADGFGTKKGVRWKIPAGGGGALIYQGDELEAYKKSYQLKSKPKDADAAWQKLVNLCRRLEQTPEEDLTQLVDILDIDASLWFLALEFAMLDGDGYFSRGSDYLLYLDTKGRFHPVVYDSNEILARTGGRGGGGARPPTIDSTPLEIIDREGRPLARLLAVPAWRARYLAHVHTLAADSLNWDNLGPFVEKQRELIDFEVEIDDKALYGFEAFEENLEELRAVVGERRANLLSHELLSGPWPTISEVTHSEASAGRGSTQVHVRAVVDDKGGKAILYVSDKRFATYREIEMHDDGAHDDGAAGDGVFAADAGTFETGTKVRFYVEARASKGDKTSFHPASSERHPIVVKIQKQ